MEQNDGHELAARPHVLANLNPLIHSTCLYINTYLVALGETALGELAIVYLLVITQHFYEYLESNLSASLCQLLTYNKAQP